MTVQRIYPAIMPETLDELTAQLAMFADVPLLHLDVMDGKAVSSVSWPYTQGGADDVLAAPLNLFERLAVHLMVADPHEIGVAFSRAGVRGVTAQLESFEDEEAARKALIAWRDVGTVEAGLSVRMDTPLARLEPLASMCDVVQLMSIGKIGFQGQPFDARIYERIATVRAAFPRLPIIVDGGITLDNLPLLAKAGADRFALGSAIARAHDPASTYLQFVAAAAAVL